MAYRDSLMIADNRRQSAWSTHHFANSEVERVSNFKCSSVCTSPRISPGQYTWTLLSKPIKGSVSWVNWWNLTWTPAASQNSTGVPLRACWWTASWSGMRTVLPKSLQRVVEASNRRQQTLGHLGIMQQQWLWKDNNHPACRLPPVVLSWLLNYSFPSICI